jgi:hypothetical protein
MADKRGTDDKHVAVPDAVKVGARSDITTVTVTGSDCTGEKQIKIYIEGGQRIIQLYRDCKAHCEEANKPFVKIALYGQILNCEFNP